MRKSCTGTVEDFIYKEKHKVPGDVLKRQASASFQPENFHAWILVLTRSNGHFLFPISESRLNQHLQSGGTQDWQTRDCLEAREKASFPSQLFTKSLNTNAPSAADLTCLYRWSFLSLSPYCKLYLTVSHCKRTTLQKPPGITACARHWRTSNHAPGWPRSVIPTGHVLLWLDQTSWCWQRNMRTSSLEAQFLFSESNKGLRFPEKH